LAIATLAKSKNPKTRLSVAVPGAALLFPYDGSNLSRDWVAGLSLAVVPVGVAYTQWAGLNPAVGLGVSADSA
jgi:MFS superfamily sulfate permease-like transporter